MTVIDFKEYKKRKQEESSRREMKKLIRTLDNVADYAYENYSRTEQEGYERFKRLLKVLDAKATKNNEED